MQLKSNIVRLFKCLICLSLLGCVKTPEAALKEKITHLETQLQSIKSEADLYRTLFILTLILLAVICSPLLVMRLQQLNGSNPNDSETPQRLDYLCKTYTPLEQLLLTDSTLSADARGAYISINFKDNKTPIVNFVDNELGLIMSSHTVDDILKGQSRFRTKDFVVGENESISPHMYGNVIKWIQENISLRSKRKQARGKFERSLTALLENISQLGQDIDDVRQEVAKVHTKIIQSKDPADARHKNVLKVMAQHAQQRAAASTLYPDDPEAQKDYLDRLLTNQTEDLEKLFKIDTFSGGPHA